MGTTPDPEVEAVNKIVQALRTLDSDAQQRVLQSALALLGLAIATRGTSYSATSQDIPTSAHAPMDSPTGGRRKGLTELVVDKKPATNSQRIVLFAYYRAKVEGLDRFDRRDLKSYFAKARLAPPGNYDRDYNTAVDSGWIHDQGDESFLTAPGEELVESNFQGAPRSTKPKKKRVGKKQR